MIRDWNFDCKSWVRYGSDPHIVHTNIGFKVQRLGQIKLQNIRRFVMPMLIRPVDSSEQP